MDVEEALDALSVTDSAGSAAVELDRELLIAAPVPYDTDAAMANEGECMMGQLALARAQPDSQGCLVPLAVQRQEPILQLAHRARCTLDEHIDVGVFNFCSKLFLEHVGRCL